MIFEESICQVKLLLGAKAIFKPETCFTQILTTVAEKQHLIFFFRVSYCSTCFQYSCYIVGNLFCVYLCTSLDFIINRSYITHVT